MTNNQYLEVAKILTYTSFSFLIAMWWAPYLIAILRWLKFWKKKSRTISMTGEALVVTKKFYENDEAKLQVPRGGGILIWFTTLVFSVFFWILLKIEPTSRLFQYLNFVSRKQTFIPIGTLFFGSMLGFIDDALSTLENGGNYRAGGLKLSQRLAAVLFLSFLIGLWFWLKLGLTRFNFFGYRLNLANVNLGSFLNSLFPWFQWSNANLTLNLGWLTVLITIIVLTGLWASSVIDGMDGLAGGVFIPIFLCYAGLSYYKHFYDIATLLMVMVGAMLAFLWFNITPAKFYMGDTGSTGVLLTIGVVAILIDAVYLLPIAGIMLVITAGSNIIQIFSKKVFKRKVFLAAPIHHHFEALGLSREQIVLRYTIVSLISSVIALVIGILTS